MGVKTKLTLQQINSFFKSYEFISLNATKTGISDTVYILKDNKNKKYILKLYENSSITEVIEEIEILNQINNLDVSKAISFFIGYSKPIVLFSYKKAKHLNCIKKQHIIQIAQFLKNLHLIKPFNISLSKRFDLKQLLHSIDFKNDIKTKELFFSKFQLVKDLTLVEDTLIHADIFPDNVSFYNDKLNAVFDFAHSCISDKNIDLSIVIISWCFYHNKFDFELIDIFLNSYSNDIKLSDLKIYLLYVSLYFSIKRYINIINKNYINVTYQEFIFIFDEINNKIL
ncbi:hypothetical protein CPU12_09290 [Malaciobacter molluscorum LMG 25693]|uniref:Type II homoserine kinase n=1 Tax=Malaciobacter molluscorum LMG 25693 TaxID=870501 RepID=A0A2G1DGJ8_9BACT|nr:phosphotransferase [Malaciobacter molluscorum]AXX92506.1 type II homoserine kinase [Malaciobacter molluscorum LMG 25693]PHO17625.1 hypothetical protein CPU12_09290 [Malaciobacter molluscorum LMG 25693]